MHPDHNTLLPHVFIDESGNSGNNILISNEPVLVLSSVYMDDDMVKDVADHFSKIRAPEWKFSTLKRRESQLKLFISLMEKDWVNSSHIKICITHKKFFGVTKFVDLLYEPTAKLNGHNLYERGAALALTNLLNIMLPKYLDDSRYSSLMQSFVKMVREHNHASFVEFSTIVREAHSFMESKLSEKESFLLDGALMAINYPHVWFPHLSSNELDPIVSTFYSMINAWGLELKQGFILVSDESKALKTQLDTIQKLSNPMISPKSFATTGNGTIEFPFQTVEVQSVDSKSHRRVQLADLFAGAANFAFSPSANSQDMTPIQYQIAELLFDKELVTSGVWPSNNISPEEVGGENIMGASAIDFVRDILAENE